MHILANDPKTAKRALIKRYNSFVHLRIGSMLDSLFTDEVVTFEQKQIIEHEERQAMRGMRWFLDNVIIASLKQGMITKYSGLVRVMENHDDLMLRGMAENLVSEATHHFVFIVYYDDYLPI